MKNIIKCQGCGSNDFRVIDKGSGLLECKHCRAKWTNEAFVHKTETEKFIEAQNKARADAPEDGPERAQEPKEEQFWQILGRVLDIPGRISRFFRRIFRSIWRLVQIIAILALIGLLVVFFAPLISHKEYSSSAPNAAEVCLPPPDCGPEMACPDVCYGYEEKPITIFQWIIGGMND